MVMMVVVVEVRRHHGGRRQIGVLILDLAVEGDAKAFLVCRSERGEGEGLGEVSTGCNGTSLARFQRRHHATKVAVGHGDFHVLDHLGLHAFDRLLGGVVDVEINRHLLPVEVEVTLKANLEV
ncbi:hypothetical protein E2C01_003082 [Portunus trituberculatus]|uniref:Uncharacterized protein n=1 Tax=Portunus trituberculatus TaxID=210409 RepID=A0A5B7CMR0_PORTR|nr:hypothetical protein [Portunus trituberculatus]